MCIDNNETETSIYIHEAGHGITLQCTGHATVQWLRLDIVCVAIWAMVTRKSRKPDSLMGYIGLRVMRGDSDHGMIPITAVYYQSVLL